MGFGVDLESGLFDFEKTSEAIECNAELLENSPEKELDFELPEDFAEMLRLQETDPIQEKAALERTIMAETRWSEEVVTHIETVEQYDIYKSASLRESVIAERDCLIKEINLDYVDEKTGLTNRERMERGLSPIDENTGEKIELHHMGQDADGPFAELCENSEHGDGNHKILHPETDGSWRKDPDKLREYQQAKVDHWKQRAQEG